MIPHSALFNKPEDREFVADPAKAPTVDYHDAIFELEKEGEWEVQRVPEPWVEEKNKFGRVKKIPVEKTWHHKSCGQCGHIPGYSTSVFWLNRKLGFDYNDPTDQTSCTAWNYYASATSNAAAQAAVAMRNFSAAAETGYFPIIHCATSFGHYKETRAQLIHHPELRRHYHKLIGEDAVYSDEIYGAQRSAIITGMLQALGIDVRDYSTWHDCCGFGFRHILVSRDFSRSFAVQRKIEVMKEEADPDVLITHDTGCLTTLDQSQFAARAHDKNVGLPVMSDSQFAALALGAHPYKVLQLHWHSTDSKPLLEKLGIDHEKAWSEFESAVERLKKGEKQFLTWEDCE